MEKKKDIKVDLELQDVKLYNVGSDWPFNSNHSINRSVGQQYVAMMTTDVVMLNTGFNIS